MNIVRTFFKSTIGKKYVMAITGLVLFGFVIGHMVGNLQLFSGPDRINGYAAFLKSQPGVLWGARLALLLMVALHIYSAVKLSLDNRAARPVPYEISKAHKASYASRTMIWSGLIIFAFVIYHLLHFTVGVVDPAYLEMRDEAGRHDVYGMVLAGFSNPLVSGFYILAVALLCVHLSHGVSSMVHSIGFRMKGNERLVNQIALTSAWVIFLGNISIPLAVLLDRRLNLIQIFQ
jgi:succinate dehydrogenase / fumarate reductase, cytochrome b subunit